MRRPRQAIPPLAVLLAALPGCDGCHGSKPYTPYTLSDLPSASAADAGPAPSTGPAPGADGGAGYPRVAATKAPDDGKRWPLEGGVAEAPAGHAFAEGLVLDADGDGKADLFAWSRAPDGLRGELWFAPGKDPASGRTVIALPDLAVPGCAIETSLARIGPATIAFDYAPRCTGRAQGKGTHWVAVFRLVQGAPPELGFEIRVTPPAEGESIAVAVDGSDRDGDGRGDLAATFMLTGAPRPFPAGAPGAEARATIAFFDRPAGLSRDPTEPEASFKALSAALVADGRKKTTAPKVPAAAVAARRLWALLCDEAGHPAVSTTAGPIRCGESRLVEDAVMAETEAALNLNEPVAALAAMSRLDGHRKDLDALFAKHVPSIAGRLARTTAATPDLTASTAFGPVAFDSTGDVLVHTKSGTVRVDHASFAESAVDPAPTWPTRLSFVPEHDAGTAPAWTLASIETRCDAPTLVARFEAASETFDTPLPILTPARCAPARVPAEILGPIAQGDLLSIRGELVAIPHEAPPHPTLPDSLALPPGAAIPPGAARSPDGTVIALDTARGVMVAQLKGQGRGASARLWTSPALDGAKACVPADGGQRIACAVKDAVAIYDAK